MKKNINRYTLKNKEINFVLILDKTTHLIYLNMVCFKNIQVFYLSDHIFCFPFKKYIEIYSFKKNILKTSIKTIQNNINTFYYTYKLKIELIGVGYKFFFKNTYLFFLIGYSHLIKIKLPNTCRIESNTNEKKFNLIHSNKYILGNLFYILKSFRKVDVYKGKGIKNIYTYLNLKLGKTKNIKK